MKPVLAVITAAIIAFGPAARPAIASPAEGAVTSLSVVPASGRAEVNVGIDGGVATRDFVLRSPDRIVLDLTGASLGLAARGYDRVARGGITDVKYSQYRRNTVRVVVYLDGPHNYTVTRGEGGVKISVTTDAASQFAAWYSGRPAGETRAAAATDAPASGPDTRVAAGEPRPAPRQAAAEPANEDKSLLSAADATASDRKSRVAYVGRSPLPQQQRSQQPRISVTYQGSDIRDVLAAFSAFSGRTIIPSSNVGALHVDAEIRDQPWDVALQAILSAQGLAATEDANGIIIVDTQDRIAARAQTEPLVTRIVRLNYQRATPMATQIAQRLLQCIPSERSGAGAGGSSSPATPAGQPLVNQPSAQQGMAPSGNTDSGAGACRGRGSVSADEVTNSVSITAPSSSVDDLVAFVESMDLRQPQVNIKAKIVLVNRSDIEGLGIRYDLGSPRSAYSDLLQRKDSAGATVVGNPFVTLGGNAIAAIANAGTTVPERTLALVFSTALGNFDFTTFLEAAQSVNLVDVQSEPSVTILNNRTATLVSGSEISFAPVTGGAGGALNVVVTAQRIQTGVTLTVTPSVTNNRQIMMHVDAQKSTFSPSSNGPLIDRNSSVTDVLVADGQTIVIGGLTETTVQVSKTGIPLLVDLPLIGRLFGTTTRNETRRDLLVLITPHIIDEGQSPSEAVRR
ncbi:MAG: type and secretion system protein [Gemmatimonadetes bacterium]|jgi:type IV pilus assembly protein PilQ|nr:type and secretion system protein [Gemmatimonadota bacterium]